MIRAPIRTPITVPSGPATGRKLLPGIIKAPQPTAQPKESAQAASGVTLPAGFAPSLTGLETVFT